MSKKKLGPKWHLAEDVVNFPSVKIEIARKQKFVIPLKKRLEGNQLIPEEPRLNLISIVPICTNGLMMSSTSGKRKMKLHKT